ncbi:MAG: hypothetical protein ACSHXB_00050 [Sulfitobacter sp.]
MFWFASLSLVVSSSAATILVLSACQHPGSQIAQAFADTDARVIVMGGDAAGLAQIAAGSPERIEPLFIQGGQIEGLRLLDRAWGKEPVDLVVNLMPLAYPHHISEQMRALSTIMQTFGRGLFAGRGALVSVAAAPNDPLALVEQGMVASLVTAGAALGDAVAPKAIRVHTVVVPKSTPERALDTLLFLGRSSSRHIKSAKFDLT